MLKVCGARNTSFSISNYSPGSKKPSSNSITYEGVYNEHKFYTGIEKEQILSCNSYSIISKDPFSNNDEFYLGLLLNSKYDGDGINENLIPLNIVICLDISGSMNSAFKRGESESKLDVAKNSLKILMKQLKKGDSLSIVLFNNEAQVLLPFTKVSLLNDDIYNKIDKLKAGGGTSLAAGIEESTQQFIDYNVFNGEGGREGIDLENRIIYLTDMCPNIGSSDGSSLLKKTKKNADNCLFTTFVGLGVDFNTNLVEQVSKTKGCNYLSVKSNSDFENLMMKDFNYLVYPIAMELDVEVDIPKFNIERIYGSPGFEKPKGTSALQVLSVFPSQKPSEYESEGGIILLKLKPKEQETLTPSTYGHLRLKIMYKSRAGYSIETETAIENPFSSIDPKYENSLRKAILLTRYVNLIKLWSIGNISLVSKETGIPPFEINLTKPVTSGNDGNDSDLFTKFHEHFISEYEYLEDDSLLSEAKIIKKLIT